MLANYAIGKQITDLSAYFGTPRCELLFRKFDRYCEKFSEVLLMAFYLNYFRVSAIIFEYYMR